MSRHLAFALVLFAASAATAAEKTVDRTFTVAPGGLLTVDADSASIHVSAADSNQVVVHIRIRASDEELANAKLDAVQDADGVAVTARMRAKGSWLNWRSTNVEGRIDVTVPKRYSVKAVTSGGSVELRDTSGPATLRTSGGEIVAKNVIGNVELKTSGGGILAETIRGDVDASTSGGDVRLLHVDGKIRGQSSGGSVQCSLVGANRGISVSTSGGGIRLTLPRNTTADIEASTSGGSISWDLPIETTVKEDDRMEGTINGGGKPIEAHTSGGGISVDAES
jgi:DUF4097 and DUF4098 domain-containing protein YvlB